jgi:deoxyadenosine/deoxycytidine kinase
LINNPFVCIAGNIGVGKTTFTDILAKHFGWKEFYESVADNPYLNDFYKDMHRWSFNLQVYFLHHRFSDHIEIMHTKKGVIQDRTIYEDVEIFARNLHQMRYMTDRDWQTYKELFKNMTQFLRKPDLIIYLRASTDTLLSRIKNRNRDFEKDISPEYLHSLNILYDRWINSCSDHNVLKIESDEFNIFNDNNKLQKILMQIEVTLTK